MKSSFATTRCAGLLKVLGKCRIFPFLDLCLPCPFVWNAFSLFKVFCSLKFIFTDKPSWNTFFSPGDLADLIGSYHLLNVDRKCPLDIIYSKPIIL